MAEQKIEFTAKEEDLIIIFKDTYNALYLEGFSNSKLNYIKSTSNPVYGKLIDNLKSPKSYTQYEYIEGPISVAKFKMEADGKPKKSFYIFGEEHRNTLGHCGTNESIEFDEYLKLLSSESPSFIDVYVELPMVKKRIKTNNTTQFINQLVANAMFKNKRVGFKATYGREKAKDVGMNPCDSRIFNQIRNRFSNCIQPELRNTDECQLIRIHNIDIRHTRDIDNLPVDLGLSLIDEIVLTGFFTTSNDIMNVLRRAIIGNSFILDALNMMKTGNLMDLLLMNKRLKHEIELSYEKVNIENFIQQKLDQYDVEDIVDMSTILLETIYNKTASTLNLQDLRDFGEICSSLNVLKADMYCLARVFKPYNIKKDNPLGAFQPVESKNIIIYAGDEHSENYVEFLEYLGSIGQNIEKTYYYKEPEDGSVSCVRIKAPEPKKDTRREEYIELLRNAPISTLKDMAKLQGLDIPPRATKKKLIELFLNESDEDKPKVKRKKY